MKDLIVTAVEMLDSDAVFEFVQQALDEGVPTSEIIKYISIGMDNVGKLFDAGTYFVADLMMAGIIFKEILEMPEFLLDENDLQDYKYTILIGTVYGDLHDIGKNIFISMAKTVGFRIVDLGIDVDKKKFADQIEKIKPDILAMSGVLNPSMTEMKNIVEYLESVNLRNCVKIIAGGFFMNENIKDYIGADEFAIDATEGVKICKLMMKDKL